MGSMIREIFLSDLKEIKDLFRSVFSGPPWNEDWSDETQLSEYLKDLIEVRGSLLFGLYDEEGTLTSSSEVAQSRDGLPASKMHGSLIGISLGKIKHWCGGTEYYIEELCIRSDLQGQGYGREFFRLIEEKLSELGLHTIYLMTDRNQPAYEFYKKLGFRELPELTSFFKEF